MRRLFVQFSDGQSSNLYQAELTFAEGSWIITYLDRKSEVQTVVWDVNEIRKPECTANVQTFRYGSFPQQIIQCTDADLDHFAKENYPNVEALNAKTFSLVGWRRLSIAVFVLVGLLVSVYFYVLPPTAAFVADKIPQDLETDLGSSMLNSFMAGSETDTKLTALVNQFANQIDFGTSYPITITVVRKSEVNAFALPGGHVVIYDEILKKMKRPEELAALLSHEVAHIQYKHSLKGISRSLAGYMFVSLLFNDINGISTVLIENANTLNNLRYSRSLETDADLKALNTLERNHIDQYGMVGLFETLNSKDDLSYLKILSTHPLTIDRIKRAKTVAKNQKDVRHSKRMQVLWKNIRVRLDER